MTNDHHIELDWTANPSCYFNCQMETCDAWDVAHDDHQQSCLDQFFLPKE